MLLHQAASRYPGISVRPERCAAGSKSICPASFRWADTFNLTSRAESVFGRARSPDHLDKHCPGLARVSNRPREVDTRALYAVGGL